MKFFFDRQPPTSLDELLGRYKTKEFESATRSTVPLLSLLKHGDAIWERLLQKVGAAGAETHFEFTVDPPQGSGTASHTDVMLVDGECAVAIEAKWTEPRYDEVSAWLRKCTDGKNRKSVLNGWLSLLQRQTTDRLAKEKFDSSVYQMLHRAASACAAGNFPTLVYVEFCPLPDGRAVKCGLAGDLRKLHRLLGSPVTFPFWLAEVETKPTPAFEKISKLQKGCFETAETVRQALRGEPLFTFSDLSLLAVRGTDCQ
jgi:hypothetical protein